MRGDAAMALLSLMLSLLQMTPEMVTCTWVQCLCFVRRAQSLKDARQTFLKASKVPDIGWQVCPAPSVSSLHAMSCSSLEVPPAHHLPVKHMLDGGFDTPGLEASFGRRNLHLFELHVRRLLSRYPVGASSSLSWAPLLPLWAMQARCMCCTARFASQLHLHSPLRLSFAKNSTSPSCHAGVCCLSPDGVAP